MLAIDVGVVGETGRGASCWTESLYAARILGGAVKANMMMLFHDAVIVLCVVAKVCSKKC